MEAIASRVQAIASRLEAIASSLEAIASRVEAIASRVEAIASRLEAIASRLEAIASRVEAIATRSLVALEAIASRLEAMGLAAFHSERSSGGAPVERRRSGVCDVGHHLVFPTAHRVESMRVPNSVLHKGTTSATNVPQ